ncbi:hypothetical protein L1887_49540 [Cichorium endivia]|nr:hypothetical protein L1887_49540 [Cichorium endivia]
MSPKATGVSFSINGTSHTITAKHEVILSAGSFGSPQILELSGIGSEDVLCAAGIEPVVCNENVGENLQDHVYMPLGFEVNPGIFTLDDLANETIFNAAFDEYLANATGPLATVALGGALLSMAQVIPLNETYASFAEDIKALTSNTTHPGLAAQHDITKRNLLSPHEAAAQHMNTASGMKPGFRQRHDQTLRCSVARKLLHRPRRPRAPLLPRSSAHHVRQRLRLPGDQPQLPLAPRRRPRALAHRPACPRRARAHAAAGGFARRQRHGSAAGV